MKSHGGHQCLWCDMQRQRWHVEGSGGGRAAHNGAVACDGAEGKRWGGAACEGQVVRVVVVTRDGASDPSSWPCRCGWGCVGWGRGHMGQREGQVRARCGSSVGHVSLWVCFVMSMGSSLAM